MISRRAIREFSNEVARRFRPRKIILFGSYAYGKPTEDSDVDLLVIMPGKARRVRMSLKIREAVDSDFPMDEFDYVFASGIFVYRHYRPNEYLRQIVRKMY